MALGLAGLLYLLVNSVAGQKGLRPTNEDFHLWIFFFFLGMSAGLALAALSHKPRLMVFAAGLLGLLPGWILAEFWAQSLG